MVKFITNKQKDIFFSESVLFIKNLVDSEICINAINWLEKNEKILINKFRDSERGMVFENINNKEFIKYFTGLKRNYGYCNVDKGYTDEAGKIRFDPQPTKTAKKTAKIPYNVE